jgi:predicted Zn-dependent protease
MLALPAVALLAWLALEAIAAGRADAVVYRASREMGAWSAAHAAPGEGAWNSVREDLLQAEAAAPRDPAIQELLGVLYAQRTDRPEDLTRAVTHFRNALAGRPTSPYTWANIAQTRYRLGQTDGDYEKTLVNAQRLGPAEPEVQRVVADYGLALWDEIGPATRAAVESAIAAGMRRNPSEMLLISARRGRLPVACRHGGSVPAGRPSHWVRICQSTEATS